MGWLFGIQENALSQKPARGRIGKGAEDGGGMGESGWSTGRPPRAPVQSRVTTAGAVPVLADGR